MPAPSSPAARFRVRIASGLMLAFGTLIAVAVAVVLSLGWRSASENTLDLLRDKANQTLLLLENRIARHLQPAEAQVEFLAHLVERGLIDLEDEAALQQVMVGALAATPQVRAIAFVDHQGLLHRIFWTEGLPDYQRIDLTQVTDAESILDEARRRHGSFWGAPLWIEDRDLTVVNVRRPIRLGTRFAGIFGATIALDELSAELEGMAQEGDGHVFVLHGDDRLIAHRGLIDGFEGASHEQPLPSVDYVRDPVLNAWLSGSRSRKYSERLFERTGVRMFNDGDDGYGAIVKRIDDYGAVPWTIGLYFPAELLTGELRRLFWSGAAGAFVLLMAVLFAWWLSRRMSQPLLSLSVAANQIRELELDGLEPLPDSRIREFSEAGAAFNSMVNGLRWFEVYVPRKLVHLLVREGAGLTQSMNRELTVMFTDIVGFTSLSEHMDADETAALLNHHFAMIAEAVEAEGGTIDKFIGDSLMAFWNAPEEQTDHAARACRAAVAIRTALEADNAARIARGEAPIRIRVGLHSGPATVGNIGAPGRINYTIVGDAVNVANRLEQFGKDLVGGAQAVTIVASARTIGEAADAVPAQAAGAHRLRGRSEEMEVFTL